MIEPENIIGKSRRDGMPLEKIYRKISEPVGVILALRQELNPAKNFNPEENLKTFL